MLLGLTIRDVVLIDRLSLAFLRELGDTLVEIQGQGEQRGLLDPATHRELLDALAEHGSGGTALVAAWRDWRAARESAEAAAQRLAESRAEEDLLRHNHAELEALAPEGDEEERLATRRLLLQNAERLGEADSHAIRGVDGRARAQPAAAPGPRRARTGGG